MAEPSRFNRSSSERPNIGRGDILVEGLSLLNALAGIDDGEYVGDTS